MNIGIMLYSQTGNTRKAALMLHDKLAKLDHSVQIEEIIAELPPGNRGGKVRLISVPDASEYDAVIIAGQVQAFALSSVMKAFLQQLPSLEGKEVALLVTKHFNNNWTGGNRALRSLQSAVVAQGGAVVAEGIIHWSSKTRDEEIDAVTDRIAAVWNKPASKK